MREYGVSLLLQWRNLGDAIVSLDEHLAEYGVDQPLCYIHDGKGFLALPAHKRYDFLIHQALDWYLWFYLAWRKRDAVFGSYERMVDDPEGYFEGALARIGHQVDRDRLAAILESPTGFTRLNVGLNGRSAQLLSDRNRRSLEDAIVDHLWSSDLEVLLWELPWEVPAIAPVGPYDGCVVRAPGRAAKTYFVSRGLRHRLSKPSSWMASRSKPGLRSVRNVSAEELKTIPQGNPIS